MSQARARGRGEGGTSGRPGAPSRPKRPRCGICQAPIHVPRGWSGGAATRRHYWAKHRDVMRPEGGAG